MFVNNQSNVTFDYVLPDQSTKSGEQDSNLVKTEILTYAVTKVKSSDKTFLNENENAQQNILITNNSATTLKSLFFKDENPTIPTTTEIINITEKNTSVFSLTTNIKNHLIYR